VGTVPKLQVRAQLLDVQPTTLARAMPRPRPRACYGE